MNQHQHSEPYVGKSLSEKTFVVTDGLLHDFYLGLDLPPLAAGLVPTAIVGEPDNSYFTEIAYPYQTGHLWLRQQLKLYMPMEKDITYEVNGSIEEIYTKRDRNVVHYGITVSDSDGTKMVESNHHQSFLAEAISGNSVEFRKPKDKPGARRFEVPQGQEFGGLHRKVTREMCGVFFHGDQNYHTSKSSAQQLGFDDVVVGGRMTLAYTSRVLEDFFGSHWWRSGELDLKFTNPVWCDDDLYVRGVVTGPHPTRTEALHCRVWIEKQDGTIALVADASVLA
ncbi:MAG: MaoC family dehydratase [Gammaproteobacteria bacterium]|nr:MaoC family dehydratase [Gammaproteobacteria bacterium]